MQWHINSKHPGKEFKFLYIKFPDGIPNFFQSTSQQPQTDLGVKTTRGEEEQSDDIEIQLPVRELDDDIVNNENEVRDCS